MKSFSALRACTGSRMDSESGSESVSGVYTCGTPSPSKEHLNDSGSQLSPGRSFSVPSSTPASTGMDSSQHAFDSGSLDDHSLIRIVSSERAIGSAGVDSPSAVTRQHRDDQNDDMSDHHFERFAAQSSQDERVAHNKKMCIGGFASALRGNSKNQYQVLETPHVGPTSAPMLDEHALPILPTGTTDSYSYDYDDMQQTNPYDEEQNTNEVMSNPASSRFEYSLDSEEVSNPKLLYSQGKPSRQSSRTSKSSPRDADDDSSDGFRELQDALVPTKKKHKCRTDALILLAVAVIFIATTIGILSAVFLTERRQSSSSSKAAADRAIDRPLSEDNSSLTDAIATTSSGWPSEAPSFLKQSDTSVFVQTTESPSPSKTSSLIPSKSPVAPSASQKTTSPSEMRTATMLPSRSPSVFPTFAPTKTKSQIPSMDPTDTRSSLPSASPSQAPSSTPNLTPSETPSFVPTQSPSESTLPSQSSKPSNRQSHAPSFSLEPSWSPTGAPSMTPSVSPSMAPSVSPSLIPSTTPSTAPSDLPSIDPSLCHLAPACVELGLAGNCCPTLAGVFLTCCISASPSSSPSKSPTEIPTKSSKPTSKHSSVPSGIPSVIRTDSPTRSPSELPTTPSPTDLPSSWPSNSPTKPQTESPSTSPTATLTITPTNPFPTSNPTARPTTEYPSARPSGNPSTERPTDFPTLSPTTSDPSIAPTTVSPSASPTSKPLFQPTLPTTELPTGAPIPDPRQAELRDLLATSAPQVTMNALDDSGSPQAAAFEWVVKDDYSIGLSDQRVLQRFALATFSFSTTQLGGTTNRERKLPANQWLTLDEGDECSWTGIFCDPTKHVWAINLAQRRLPGQLPPEWALLKDSLQLLDVTNNDLTGGIPEEYGELRNLRWLRVNGNRLSGHFPSSLGQLKSLMHLNVHRNNFGGPFPNEAIASMTGLLQARMYFNNFTGTMGQEVCDKGMSILEVDCVQEPTCTFFCF